MSRGTRLSIVSWIVMFGIAAAAFAAEESDELTGAAGGAAPASAARPVGPPLESDIVSVYIPPTRASEPFAATAQSVYVFDNDKSAWREIYRVPTPGTRILGITGYAKSSQALYIAHSKGVARTRNGGAEWDEAEPAEYALQAGSFVGIAVNPAERREAVLATARGAWASGKFGATWSPLSLPSQVEEIRAVAFAGGNPPRLIIATANALYVGEGLGKNWRTLSRSLNGPQLVGASSESPFAAAYYPKALRYYDIARPGHSIEAPVDLAQPAESMAVDCAGRGAAWLASGLQIVLTSFQSPGQPPVAIRDAGAPVRNLQGHPRRPEGLLWTEGPTLYELPNAFGPLDTALAAAIPAERFTPEPGATATADALAPRSPEQAEANALLDRLMAGQPPLEEAVAAALEHASYRKGDIESWRKNVRKRYLLPRVVLDAGRREYPLDRWSIAENVDRFGVRTIDDIHRSEQIRSFNNYGIELRWDLTEMLFNYDQLRISKEARYQAEMRNELIAQITQLYYDRLELLLELEMNAETMAPKDRLTARLHLREMTDHLNQLCGRRLFAPDAQAPARSRETPPR